MSRKAGLHARHLSQVGNRTRPPRSNPGGHRMRKVRGSMLQGAWLAMEAQQVIALRLMKLTMGGPAAQ